MAVGARRIEVADAGVLGGAEQLVRFLLEDADAAIAAQVPIAMQGDVTGAAERGQAQAERRYQ